MSHAKYRFIVQSIYHRCPYKQQDVPAASCHINSQDYYHSYCYGCDVPERIVKLYGLRTHKKVAVPATSTLLGLRFIYSPIAGGRGVSWMVVDLETSEAMTLQEYARRKSLVGGRASWADRARCQTLTGTPEDARDTPQAPKLVAAAKAAHRLRKADRQR